MSMDKHLEWLNSRSPTEILHELAATGSSSYQNLRQNRDNLTAEIERLRKILFWAAAHSSKEVQEHISRELNFTQADLDYIRSMAP